MRSGSSTRRWSGSSIRCWRKSWPNWTALPEPEPAPYARDDPRWGRFGILLSGIISTLNDHELGGMDVEEHIPVMEQQIVSLVRRSWGINGRGRAAGHHPLPDPGGLHPALRPLL